MRLRFLSLGSGSSGNCYLLSTGVSSIMIDAGIGIRSARRLMKDLAIDLFALDGLLLTHEHLDHVRSAGYFGGKLGIPVYATREVFRGIEMNSRIRHKIGSSARAVEKHVAFSIGGFRITPFPVHHDSLDNVGYRIEWGGLSFVIITDCGCVTGDVMRYASGADYLVVEANHDLDMLASGPYPFELKRRVASPSGHLSNVDAGSLVGGVFSSNLKHVWLCHLSNDNNTPELASAAVRDALAAKCGAAGREVGVTPLPRTEPAGWFDLG